MAIQVLVHVTSFERELTPVVESPEARAIETVRCGMNEVLLNCIVLRMPQRKLGEFDSRGEWTSRRVAIRLSAGQRNSTEGVSEGRCSGLTSSLQAGGCHRNSLFSDLIP